MRTKVVLTLLSALALVKAIDIPSTSINDIEEVQNNTLTITRASTIVITNEIETEGVELEVSEITESLNNEEDSDEDSEASNNEELGNPSFIRSVQNPALNPNINPNLATKISPEEEHYISELSENVIREKVYYPTRYGIELAGDLYLAKGIDMSKKHPAILVGAPFGGTKEQAPSIYANELAQRGFVVLTFDPSYYGYSGGLPRFSGSSSTYTEDFSAGIDFLGVQDFVDTERIGVIGICGSGGFSLGAAAQDSRIKAVIPIVMYDIADLNNSVTGAEREEVIASLSVQRWKDALNGTPAFTSSYLDHPIAVEEIPVPKNDSALDDTWWNYYHFYATERGWHKNALASHTDTSNLEMSNLPTNTHIAEIKAPILFIAGDIAHSRPYAEKAYASAAEDADKELYLVKDAVHVDLYDNLEKIPFDKIENFLKEKLEI